MALEHIQPGKWNSRAVIHNGFICMSGIVADDTTANMKDQTADVLRKIDAILEAAGSDKSKIISSMVYISDMSLKDEMNEAWMEWMGDLKPPARACVGVDSVVHDTGGVGGHTGVPVPASRGTRHWRQLQRQGWVSRRSKCRHVAQRPLRKHRFSAAQQLSVALVWLFVE